MKNRIQILLMLSIFYTTGFSQSFTVTGPRTIYSLSANRGTGKFTFFNFDTGKEVSLADSNSTKWDIGFSSTNIILNGGLSGPGTVTGQVLTGTTFISNDEAPTTGYTSDGATRAITGWYNYFPGSDNSGPHTIVPVADKLIAIKLADRRYVKLEILNYYKDAPLNVPTTGPAYTGISKYYSFRYLIAPTSSSDWSQLFTKVENLNANLVSHYNFFNLASADTAILADSNSTNWDIAFRSTSIIINGGLNGPDKDSVQIVASEIADVENSPLTNWGTTVSSWYDYNSTTHVISPAANKTIVVKTSNGRYAKIDIDTYYKDGNTNGASRYYSFTYFFQPDGTSNLKSSASVETSIINASNIEGFGLFPNPISSGIQSFNIKAENSSSVIRVFDVFGNQLFQSKLIQGVNEIIGLDLQQGIYMVSLEDNGVLSQQKLIVE